MKNNFRISTQLRDLGYRILAQHAIQETCENTLNVYQIFITYCIQRKGADNA